MDEVGMDPSKMMQTYMYTHKVIEQDSRSVNIQKDIPTYKITIRFIVYIIIYIYIHSSVVSNHLLHIFPILLYINIYIHYFW